MHYIIGDVHNDHARFKELIRQISLIDSDPLYYLLGDLFDRSDGFANPVDVYYQVLMLGDRCHVIRGNHDEWLAEYIQNYYSVPERKRKRLPAYHYNTFELLKDRMTEVDMLDLATYLKELPLQVEIDFEDKYLLAHAMTTDPHDHQSINHYLMGDGEWIKFLEGGVPGYISYCGHLETNWLNKSPGRFLDEGSRSIWINEAGNVYMMDCGCGYNDGRLAGMCIETKERFYV